MSAIHATDVFKNVLSAVERLDANNVVLPREAGKKAFAHYPNHNDGNLNRVDESADHADAPFDYSGHSDLEMVFGVRGRAELALAGQRYALDEGELAIVPPGTAHLERIHSRKQSYHLLWLKVKGDRLFLHSSLYSRADRFQIVRGAFLSRSAAIGRCFESAAEEALSGKPYWMSLLRARLTEGWVLALRSMETHGVGLNPAQVQRSTIDEAKAFMQAHYSEDLSLEQIAGRVFLSSAYFSSLFSRNENKTVFEYLHELRIAEARRLLAGTTLSTKQIARRVGIPSASYFCRLFRRLNGCSAQEYRMHASSH